ncbi:MAG: HAD hydrolase family protein [Syntrophobacteraceae bacterium]|nr:HAD hydrolase family protein [Syntrophobacteraceae bacterium]
MVEIEVPGRKPLSLSDLVLDYNGTLALDGKILPGAAQRLLSLAGHLRLHVLTADTFGSVGKELADLPCRVFVIATENQAEAKAEYLRQLGPQKCVAIGNGRNDALMLKAAALGIAVVQAEGASVEALFSADVLSRDILEALDLLLNPLRLVAALRS